MKDKYLKEGLYYLYQHTKKCNAKAPLIEKKTTKKAKKKTKKKVKKKVKKVREIAVVFLTGYEPVQEDPEETKRIEEFIEGIGESALRIERKKRKAKQDKKRN